MSKRNEPCPCGSGKKYKKCCALKEHREVKLDKQSIESIEKQLQEFRKKFGREPGPNEPIFFDPESDVPVPMPIDAMTAGMTLLLREAGIPAELIYAF